MNLQSTLRTSAGVAAVALLAAAWTMLAYAAGPPMALAALVSAGVVVAVMWQPMVGVYLGLLSIPLELLSFRVGGSFGLSPSELLFLLTAAATAFHVAARSRTITPSPAFGWFLALLGIVLMMVGGAKRAAEVERRRKPPGVM